MGSLNLLIVEGNIKKDTDIFIKAAGCSVAENFKNLALKLNPSSNIDIVHPGNDTEASNTLKNIDKYHGIVFTGGAMRINDMTDEIKKHIDFAKECFTHNKKILAICWGLQVCVTAAGGKVAPGKNGAHIGIAANVKINEEGKKNNIYKDKQTTFTTPAFNFDEVCEIPKNATLLASDDVNKVMGVYFKSGNSEIWGLQYHPDYEYYQMINLSNFRKQRILEKKYFNSDDDYQKHINYIQEEDQKVVFQHRSCEVKNWLELISD